MTNVFFDSRLTDEARRERLYQGDLFVYSPSSASIALVDHARNMIEDAFGGRDPLKAQFDMPVEDYVAILAKLKPAFIHHPRCKELVAQMLADYGCDLEQTYFDVPRMRTATSDNYLTSGIAYAFHPHRDTWYSAPPSQLNWWMPIYDVAPDNVMAFHPVHFDQPVKNSSDTYNYYRWNEQSRASAAQHIKEDTRQQPKPLEPATLNPDIRIVAQPGAPMVFSGAQLHSTVPNSSGVTRFSIDFRTVHAADVAARRGAANVDSACTGTSLRDFLRASDLSRLPEADVAQYDEGPVEGVLVYEPTAG